MCLFNTTRDNKMKLHNMVTEAQEAKKCNKTVLLRIAMSLRE